MFTISTRGSQCMVPGSPFSHKQGLQAKYRIKLYCKYYASSISRMAVEPNSLSNPTCARWMVNESRKTRSPGIDSLLGFEETRKPFCDIPSGFLNAGMHWNKVNNIPGLPYIWSLAGPLRACRACATWQHNDPPSSCHRCMNRGREKKGYGCAASHLPNEIVAHTPSHFCWMWMHCVRATLP